MKRPLSIGARALVLPLSCWLLGILLSAPAPAQDDGKIHESVIAGSWYPADPTVLGRQLDGFLAQAPVATRRRPLALIAPHAGYAYSGAIAACAYRQLQGQAYQTVVIIAPSHRVRFPGVSVYDPGGYRTPLGIVPIDRAMVRRLEKDDIQIRYQPEAHEQEHSLEIQLPFLQRVLGHFQLVPLVMGEQSWTTCQRLASTLGRALAGKSALIVASSDLSHYHNSQEAKSLDDVVLTRVSRLDPRGLYQDLAAGRCEACGGGPIVTTLLAAQILGAGPAEILRYGHSGQVTGDNNAVVGYLAAAIWPDPTQQGQPRVPQPAGSKHLNLSPAERAQLLTLARSAISAASRNQPIPALETTSSKLAEPRGAFVTLHEHQQLRGCIGTIFGRRPLADTIARMAVAAAFQDPRFRPVEEREIPDLVIEISILSPLERVRRIDEIRVGRQGLYIRSGSSAGLLLPQVAAEYGWDTQTFLGQTCRKAGLSRTCWREPETEIYRFEAEILRESP